MFKDEVVAELPKLRHYAHKLCRDTKRVDDLVNDTVARALDREGTYVPQGKMISWLCKVMHNQFINMIRKDVRDPQHIGGESVEWASSRLTSSDDTEIRVRLRDAVRALESLNEDQRQAVMLTGYHGLSYQEVAERLQVPVGTVRSRVSRGRDLLRQMVEA